MMTKMSSKGHGKVRTRCGNAAEVLNTRVNNEQGMLVAEGEG